MQYLTQSRSILSAALATMTNQVPSTAIRRTARGAGGKGSISLSGSYTGAVDAVYDIEITSDTVSGDPTVSTPVFTGVGNGTLSGLSVDPGTAAQTVTATLVDLGIPTRAAFAPFQSVTLRAVSDGSHGNGLTVSVSQSGLTRTASAYSVTSDIQAGTAEYQGEQYNFGAVNLEPEGTVPANAPRVAFGNDPMVYRHWRTFAGGRYTYHLSPAPVRDYPVGTPVYVVTGGRTVDVSNSYGTSASTWASTTVYALGDAVVPTTPNGLWYECTAAGTSDGTEPTWGTTAGGTTTDDGVTWICRGKITTQYTGVATLYDLLSDIEADATALVEVDGVVANDRRPGGMACDDLVQFTASFAQDITGGSSRYAREADINLTVASNAPTETLTIYCKSATQVGEEIWSVRGDVSGDLPDATTGEFYTAGSYTFTIEPQLPPAQVPSGRIAATFERQPRTADQISPSMCKRGEILGAAARDRTLTFVWEERGAGDCPCSPLGIIGGPNDEWLGVTPEVAMGDLSAAILTPYTTVTDWERDFIVSQVSADDTSVGSVPQDASPPNDPYNNLYAVVEKVSSILQIDKVDVEIAKRAARIWRNAITDIHAQKNAWPTAAGTAFTTEFSNFQTFMADGFGGLIGADFALRIVQKVLKRNGSTELDLIAALVDTDTTSDQAQWIAQQGARFLTSDIEAILDRVRAQVGRLYVASELMVPFDDAARSGTGVWQDHGGSGWFVSQDGLLPIQPGFYYHSAIEGVGPDGGTIYLPTYEFGVGIDIGCPESLVPGDRIVIKISDVVNPRQTFAPGDSIVARIVRADPIAFGGGQTGDDTLTWRVVGTVDGPLDDYALVTTSPSAYSDGGVDFLITPGAIDYELGDLYSFAIEGGQFRWRKDAGSWTSGVDIAPSVSLSDGLSAVFAGGAPPSFVVGDVWSFQALATNGIDRLRTPDDRSARWTGSTVIEFAGDPLGALLLWHDIPSNAEIRLQGSDDGFSTTPFDRALTWRRGVIAARLDSAVDYAEYRITVNASGSLRWAWAGEGLQPAVPSGISEPGSVSMTGRLQRPGSIRGRDAQIEHTHCTQSSVDALLDALEHATENHDGVLGMLLADGEGYVVTVNDAVQLDDILRFHPDDPANRLVGVRVQLGAAA